MLLEKRKEEDAREDFLKKAAQNIAYLGNYFTRYI